MENPKVWEIFPALCERVREDHIRNGMEDGDHSFDHALSVGQVALMIADRPEIGRLAGAAGLCHNADRILTAQNKHQSDANVLARDVNDELIRTLVQDQLASTEFNPDEREIIVDAIVRHGGKNNVNDHPVLVTLRDADRIANIDASGAMRAGKQAVPVVDPAYLLDDPKASYFEPRSVLWNLNYMSTKWDPEHPQHDPDYCLRLPKAIEFAKPYLAFLREYVQQVLAGRERLGLVPYPFAPSRFTK